MDFMELAAARYSLRDYDPRPVEEEKLAKILEAGRIAPTAKNNQCHRVYVLKSPEALEKIRSLTRCAFNAPVVMLLAYNTDEEWHNPLEAGITAGSQDCAIVATHMMLQAQELGVGSCWVCFFPNTAVKEALGLPENEKPALLMPMGYPAEGAGPSPRHFERKPMESLVTEL